MNRTQMIEKIAEHTGQDKKTVGAVLSGLSDVVLATVAKGDSVMLPGIAKFTKVKRKARIGRNPATGASIRIPAKTAAKVTALKLYKDTVLGTTPAPKLQKTGTATATKPATTRRTAAAAKTGAAAKAPAKTTRAAAKPAAKTATKVAAAKAPARATSKVAAAKTTRTAKPAAKATAAKAPARSRAKKA
jgi:DNA-binding protein HU-beta